jgi:hypothetical protein
MIPAKSSKSEAPIKQKLIPYPKSKSQKPRTWLVFWEITESLATETQDDILIWKRLVYTFHHDIGGIKRSRALLLPPNDVSKPFFRIIIWLTLDSAKEDTIFANWEKGEYRPSRETETEPLFANEIASNPGYHRFDYSLLSNRNEDENKEEKEEPGPHYLFEVKSVRAAISTPLQNPHKIMKMD